MLSTTVDLSGGKWPPTRWHKEGRKGPLGEVWGDYEIGGILGEGHTLFNVLVKQATVRGEGFGTHGLDGYA